SSKQFNQAAEIPVARLTGGFDLAEHETNGIHRGEERAGKRRVDSDYAVAQFAEQIFTNVGYGFQFSERKKATAPFESVDRAKDARERLLRMRVLFQRHQIPIQTVQVLVTFNK